MKLKIMLAASALALLATGGARAADVVLEEPAPIEVPVFTWTGFYVGIQGGYVWTDLGGDFDSLNGGLLGGYVGYNYQFDQFVLGIEGDFNATWTDDTFVFAGPPTVTVDVGQDWLASIRARAGFAWDRLLIFGTGGVAWTEGSADITVAGFPTISGDQTFTGWTLGGGVEYAFDDNWLGRVEYRYYAFDDEDFDGPGSVGSVDFDTQTITLGVAYKF